MKVSVIIPTFNEEKDIDECLESLNNQTFKNLEIIVVDDGSVDNTLEVLSTLKITHPSFGGKNEKLKILKQKHRGPGEARNLGAKEAKGEILVFVDADMTFDKRFIEELVDPIIKGQSKGTFSKEEYLKNKDNNWSLCWNINRGLPIDRMHPNSYPDVQHVFRAILKEEFEKADGFESIGYVDDYTLSEKLGYKATAALGAVIYHKNPSSLIEVFKQARWVGKSEYKRRKIKNENLMRVLSIIRYSLPFSIFNGFVKSFKYNLPQFLIFKVIYDFAVELSLINSFYGEQRYK